MIKHLVFYVLSAAIKDKIFLLYVGLVAIILSLSIFFGSSAVTEQDQFSAVFTSGALRIASSFTLILFIIFYFRRSFDNRDVDFLFSRPISRLQFVLAHFIAFSILSLLIAIVTSIGILILTPSELLGAALIWGLTIFLELVVLSVMAMFFGIALSTAVSATLVTICFYILARLMGDIIGILESGISNLATQALGLIMTVISFFIPRLDLIGQTSWLVYGVQDFNYIALSLQIIIFIGLVLSATYLDLKRRQF